jgi:hypothetical protein
MCAAVRTPVCGLDSLAPIPKVAEGLMNHFDELISAPQYLNNVAVATLPANAIVIRSALVVGVVDAGVKVSGNISSK